MSDIPFRDGTIPNLGYQTWYRSYGEGEEPGKLPLLALHGGPGGGSIRGLPRRFDPAVYRLVQFDQRGCGDSLPHASDFACDMSFNTTAHLVGDIDRIEGRKIFVTGQLRVAADDRLCAEARALFLSMPPEVFDRLMGGRRTG